MVQSTYKSEPLDEGIEDSRILSPVLSVVERGIVNAPISLQMCSKTKRRRWYELFATRPELDR